MTDQKLRTIFLDVKPASVSVEESYQYDLKIRANPETLLLNDPDHPETQPHGEIKINVPYDGFTSFPIATAKKSQPEFSPGKLLTGKIGWLALGKPLNWEGDWSPQTGLEELVPVSIPLFDSQIRDSSDWIADRYRAEMTYPFSVDTPRYTPLQIEMQVFESNDDQQFSQKDDTRNQKNKREFIESLTAKPITGGQLWIEIKIATLIPEVFVDQSDQPIEVVLEDMGIYWPNLVSSSQLQIYCPQKDGLKNVVWRFDPDQQAVQIQNLGLDPVPGKQRAMLVPYELNLFLLLHVPGKLVRDGLLKGWANIRLDNLLLSSRGAAWLNAGGARVDHVANKDKRVSIHKSTVLQASFSAYLDELYKRRNSTVYRQWYFHGISLSSGRLEDIASSLRDLGYSISKTSGIRLLEKEKEEKDKCFGTVSGERLLILPDQDPKEILIQIYALPAAHAETRVEREIPQGGVVSTQLPTSDLIILVRGQVSGNGNILALDLEKLMVNLKNRLLSVADMR